jgi:hypothetical protein
MTPDRHHTYNTSEKGRARMRRYRQSAKGKEANARYETTAKAVLRQLRQHSERPTYVG